nr:Chain C, MAP peptide [Mus musculus]6LZ4_F Chain F, MAP peptide [Mus musculus]
GDGMVPPGIEDKIT